MVKYMLVGVLALVAAGVASAQPAPPPEGPRDGMRGEEMRGPHGHGMMRRMMEGGRAARFHFTRGDATVDIKCAADEPMKACIDAATTLLDKLTPAAK